VNSSAAETALVPLGVPTTVTSTVLPTVFVVSAGDVAVMELLLFTV
jgi:hypothetical protein